MASSRCPSCGIEIDHDTGKRGAPPNQLGSEQTLERIDCPRCKTKLIRALSPAADAVWHTDHSRD